MAQKSQGIGLTWKITITFLGTIGIIGVLVLGIVYELAGKALRDQVGQRTTAIALNLSDAAAGYVLSKNGLELHTLVTKYGRLDGIAYVFIQDGRGAILANSLRSSPDELRQNLPIEQRREPNQRRLFIDRRPVREARVPILEGQVGTAHVGLWEDAVENEIYGILFPILRLVLIVLLVGLAIALVLSRSISRPIRRLSEIADRISTGDLDTPVGLESSGEVGDLARSVERMRASLKAAMLRLNRAQSSVSIWLVALLFGTFFSFEAGAMEAPATGAPKKIAIAYSSISGNMAPLWITYEKGFFRKHGLDAQLVFLEGGSRAAQSLARGDVALAQMAGAGVIESKLKGSDAVMIAGVVNTLTFQFFVEATITRPEMLKGKVVGVTQQGSSTDFAIRYALDKYGLNPEKDVTILQLGSMPALLGGLESGTIQGAMLSAPSTLKAKKGGFRVLADLQMLGLEYQHTGLATTKSLINSQPELIRNAVKAYVEGIHYYKTHRRESLEILQKYLKTDDTEALTEIYEDVGLTLVPEKPYPTLRGIQTILRELTPKEPKAQTARAEDFVDLTFVRELDKSGFIDRLYQSKVVAASKGIPRPPAPVVASKEKPKAEKPAPETALARPFSPQPTEVKDQAHEYAVIGGDTLSRLAGRYYGDPLQWPKIYQANRETVKNPHFIYIGQRLIIPPGL